ncbi:hypothetical protein ACU635_22040 [[Actinomadura] parvosata]|uniref:hypothetical protein n=1 Tax=[Actinomadura] parvosata TaxID=1955412 RepID=UPI00406C97F2
MSAVLVAPVRAYVDEALRRHRRSPESPRTVSVDGDRLLAALAPGAVEPAFGRDHFCVPYAPFPVRAPDGRLPGLVIRRS